MYKEFNAFNKLKSQRFVLLQNELSKSLHKNMRKSIKLKVRKGMKEVRDKLSFCASTMASNSQHVQDLKEKNNPAEEKDAQHPDQIKGKQISGAKIADIVQGEQPSAQVVLNKEKDLVVHNPEEKKSEGTHLLKPKEQQKSLHDFTDELFGTTSSKFSPTPPREPTPPRDPAKGKEVAIVKEQVNKLITYQEEGVKWLDALASKKIGKSNDMLLQSLRAKLQWVMDQAKKLGLPPPQALATFGMTAKENKRKRT
ncbi:hypothetical protein Tco_0087446 [Tanacetum coccineum]